MRFKIDQMPSELYQKHRLYMHNDVRLNKFLSMSLTKTERPQRTRMRHSGMCLSQFDKLSFYVIAYDFLTIAAAFACVKCCLIDDYQVVSHRKSVERHTS